VILTFLFFQEVEKAAMATPNGLARIDTNGGAAKKKKHENGICHDDSSAPVRAQNIDELHSMQRKRSAPTTPIKLDGAAAASPFAPAISEEDRRKQQLQSIRFIHPHPPGRAPCLLLISNLRVLC
jgi:phosphoenolpyruvate carboxykinase (ATP)